jgi:hypothetical protein
MFHVKHFVRTIFCPPIARLMADKIKVKGGGQECPLYTTTYWIVPICSQVEVL